MGANINSGALYLARRTEKSWRVGLLREEDVQVVGGQKSVGLCLWPFPGDVAELWCSMDVTCLDKAQAAAGTCRHRKVASARQEL